MISVIVPVYNVEKYIDKCIESILCQTWKDFELILVNDGSTDASGEICSQFAKKDRRIRVFEQQNKGLSGARNTGTKQAKGEYLTYIDSDDFIHPEYLEVLYKTAVDNQTEVAACAYQNCLEGEGFGWKKEKVEQPTICTGREAVFRIVRDNSRQMIVAWGKIYHADLKEMLIYPEGKVHEDEFVTYKVLYAAEKVSIVDRPLYAYVQRKESIINTSYSKKRLHKLYALNEAIKFFEAQRDVELRDIALKRYLLNIQIAWYRVHKHMKEQEKLLQELCKEWQKEYQNSGKIILKKCSIVDVISIVAFKISPRLYSLFAEIVLMLFPEI